MPLVFRRIFPPLAVLFLAVLAALGSSRPAQASLAAVAELCAEPIRNLETRYGLPGQLLMAVSLIESGRWDAHEERVVPWPWAVYAEGEGRYFASKDEAVAAVERLREKGVSNIDVGCMQINLYHHPDAFASLEEAFAPERNVGYAVRFLLELYEAKRSWANAVATYHSSTPQFARPYRHKFIVMWNQERRRINEIRRQEKLAEIEKRRAEREKRKAEEQGQTQPASLASLS